MIRESPREPIEHGPVIINLDRIFYNHVSSITLMMKQSWQPCRVLIIICKHRNITFVSCQNFSQYWEKIEGWGIVKRVSKLQD